MVKTTVVAGITCKLGHNNPALSRFMKVHRGHLVPVKIFSKKGHDGERHKPETGKRVNASFNFS